MNYKDWTVYGTYLEDVSVTHKCGYYFITEIDSTIQDVLDKIAEHIKEKHENPA